MQFLRVLWILAVSVMAIGLTSGVASAFDKSAGPIWNNGDAQGKCPGVCAPGTWDGNWRTVVPGMDSVCNCQRPRGAGWQPAPGPGPKPWRPRIQQVNAGPIWNNADAQNKCPRTCGGRNMWDGNWRTVGFNQSTCDCYRWR